MTKRRLLNVISVFVMASVPPAHALDAVLTDDISVSSASAKTLPTGNRLRLALSETDTVYLKFDLASVLPAGVTSARVEKATLWVWVSSLSKQGWGNIGVHPVLSHWSENSFPTDPTPAVGPRGAVKAQDRAQQFAVFDVTPTVRGWLDGTANYGVALRVWAPTGGFEPFFAPNDPVFYRKAFRGVIDSKENVASARLARLQLALLPPPAEPTPP